MARKARQNSLHLSSRIFAMSLTFCKRMSFTFRTTCQNSWVLRNHSKHPQTLNSTRRIWKKTSSTRIRGQRKEVYKHSTTCLQFCNLAHEILLWRVWLHISANICRKGRSISNNICKAQLSISNVSAKWTSAGRQPTSARGSADTSAANICHSSTHGGKNFYGNFRHA